MSSIDPTKLFLPRGVILNRDLSVVHQLDMDDPAQVQELVSSSWYDYSAGKDTPLHPYDGETTPHYTGPAANASYNLDFNGSYSWVKSPRWRGKAVEVGPLSHVLMLYASGHEKTQNLVNSTLSQLKLPVEALFSTMGRTAARTLEAKLLADEMDVWFTQLQANFAAGDVKMFNEAKFDPATWGTEPLKGAGFLEAPRGALGHWVVIDKGKIANYQCVVPTTWNAGPRTFDFNGQEVMGPYEAALQGHKLVNPDQPLEILRTRHSFVPCMGCAVHLMDEEGEERLQVKVK